MTTTTATAITTPFYRRSEWTAIAMRRYMTRVRIERAYLLATYLFLACCCDTPMVGATVKPAYRWPDPAREADQDMAGWGDVGV